MGNSINNLPDFSQEDFAQFCESRDTLCSLCERSQLGKKCKGCIIEKLGNLVANSINVEDEDCSYPEDYEY